MRLGPAALADRELIALMLGSGTPTSSALAVAEVLLADFGSLSRLAAARPEDLMRFEGVGPTKAARLTAAFALSRRSGETAVPTTIRQPADIVAAVEPLLIGLHRERVVVAICDAANRLLRVEVVSDGAQDRAMFPVREILNAVLRHDGRAFAVAHNHPTGERELSIEDSRATQAIADAARVAGLRFLGHVVVAGDGNDVRPLDRRMPD